MFSHTPGKGGDKKDKKEVHIDEQHKEAIKDEKHDKKDTKRDDKRKSASAHHAGDGTVVVSKEAVKALSGGLPDAIVDIRITANEKQVAEVSRQEYIQLFQDSISRNADQGSTFGNKCSLWFWKRSKGTCSGRLKPIVDLQLHNKATDSAFVLAGYTCDGVPISGQYLWIRRAVSEDEEKDAIVDLYITTGKMKDRSDPIWTSPGVGWIHVDGNFTKSALGRGLDTLLWIRPARSRSSDVQYVSPLRAAVAMTDEVKYAKLLSVTRLALRHYVHLDDMKRLSMLQMETGNGGPASSAAWSERLKDFTALFHRVGAKGSLNSSKFSNMLNEVGLRLARAELTITFNLFDTQQNGHVSIEEFAGVLTLTDYELDLALEKIRVHLLKGCAPSADALRYEQSSGQRPGFGARQQAMRPGALARASSGVLGGIVPSATNAPTLGRNVIKERVTLSHIFLMINGKDDGILSLHEMMDLSTKVEVFVTEEEARRMLAEMDRDRNDRVEEGDFIYFMQQESQANTRKAFRVREAACSLRRWLLRGTTESANGATSVTASAEQWARFKKTFEKLTGKKFPGFIGAPVLMTVMANLNFRLSALEARELTFLVSPDKSGRIHQTELHSFMGRENRSYGELLALLERELLKTIVDACRESRDEEEKTGQEDPDLLEKYRKIAANIRKEVENVYNKPAPGQLDGDGEMAAAATPVPIRRPTQATGSQEIISVGQLQEGMASYFAKNKYAKEVPENLYPNLEEWASLSVLVDAAITEGDIYGVRLKLFLDQLCLVIVTRSEEIRMKQGEKHSAERVALELRRQIKMEARAASKGKKPDYKYVFDLFDENKNGSINIDELREQLKRLQLLNHLADHQVPALMEMFTKGEKHFVELNDFINFA